MEINSLPAMNPCDDCSIEDKICECCGRCPVTGDVVLFPVDGKRYVNACPNLNKVGRCRIYTNRPHGCRVHVCNRFRPMEKPGGGYQSFLTDWAEWFVDDFEP